MEEMERELLFCAQNGNFDRVRDLVENHGVSVECTNASSGTTPLMCSVRGEQPRVARYLLEKGANVDTLNQNGHKAVFYAILHDSAVLIRLLVEYGADIEASCSKEDVSPLAVAVLFREVDVVTVLLELGAKTDETLFVGSMRSALSIACMVKNAEIVQVLIAHNGGANINTISVIDGVARTPLCFSCLKNSVEITEILLHNGAQVIYPGGDSRNIPNPLYQTVRIGSLDLLQRLLANVQETDPMDQLDIALKDGVLLNELEMAQMLVQHGANVDSRLAVLCKCADKGLCDGALFLLQKGANPNLTNSRGQTPLWITAEKGDQEMVGLFLDANADVGIQCSNSSGETPFAVAQRKEHVGVVYLLLRGAYDNVGRAELGGKGLFELIAGRGNDSKK